MRKPKRLSKLSLDELHAVFAEAQSLMRQERYDEAERILARFARETPHHDHGMVWYELAEIFEKKGEIEHADSAYRRALDCEWNEIYASAYGSFLWHVGLLAEAVSVLRELQRRQKGQLAGELPYSVAAAINAIEEGIPYESFWERRWPRVGAD